MNVRNKIYAFLLSAFIIFNTVSNSYANSFVSSVPSIPSPMVSAIATVGVGCGIVYQSVEDIGNFVRAFYDYNAYRWEDVKNSFLEGCSVAKDGVLTIGSNFLNYCEETFNNICNKIDQSNGNTIKGYYLGYPVFHDYPTANTLPYRYSVGIPTITPTKSDFTVGGLSFDFQGTSGSVYIYKVYGGSYSKTAYINSEYPFRLIAYVDKPYVHFGSYHIKDGKYYSSGIAFTVPLDSVTFSETWANSFDWGNGIGKDVIDGKVSVNAPANVSDLVNKGADVVTGNPSYDLPIGGSVSVGGVTHDTLEFDDSITFPVVDSPSIDIPSDTPSDTPIDGSFASIKEFIISLVVPSDTFWTDTFNSFRDNFSNNFPMLDMSKFDSLAVGGKPFPNLYAYGSKIVDGDVINSIVDWLRPIIAGFIMICLMFFNYRKIYKLIRNTEPFGGIAQGTSDFRTGLSAPPINNGLDSNPMGNLRDTLFDMRNEILRRENEK